MMDMNHRFILLAHGKSSFWDFPMISAYFDFHLVPSYFLWSACLISLFSNPLFFFKLQKIYSPCTHIDSTLVQCIIKIRCNVLRVRPRYRMSSVTFVWANYGYWQSHRCIPSYSGPASGEAMISCKLVTVRCIHSTKWSKFFSDAIGELFGQIVASGKFAAATWSVHFWVVQTLNLGSS